MIIAEFLHITCHVS